MNVVRKEEIVSDFLQQVRQAMEDYFGADARRIAHALQVTAYAEELLAYIDADPTVTLTAAYLHDIGIPAAERIHGSCSGSYQEELGPSVAREILSGLDASAELIETVCAMIGKHHTPGGVDSPEFRILWDADALVNLDEVVPGKSSEQLRTILDKWLVTEPGYRRALDLFLS
jgi:putative nucleotidyltransferase with HDIG domain